MLDGIREMSMAWVVIGHALLLGVFGADNFLYTVDRSTNLLFQTVLNASPSVDTFFVLSGLLVMLGGLRSLGKLQKPVDLKIWATFYVHRLTRLWPTLILGILFVIRFIPLFSKLTYSPGFQPYATNGIIATCEGIQNWAPTIFFYNNFMSLKATPCIGMNKIFPFF